ncbi:MAG: 50S ribosomal protein L9 [Rhizobiales bacterium]|nr:50S ribosomal protein L9 [Hyphomicrobiales bacterium]
MKVILLERIRKLGQMGETVTVKDGFARNYLLPQGKALRANEKNQAHFDAQRAELEARNLELKGEATKVGEKIADETFVAIRQAGDTGQLYGSVSSRDIADTICENGIQIDRNQILLNRPIKVLGVHEVLVSLHPEVEVKVNINVARTEEEAERQARGEDVTLDVADDEEEDVLSAEDVFEEGAEPTEEDASEEGEEASAEAPAEEEDKDA